ncbi:hypothetical protein QBC39DRAFT_254656 [Podospora conica]|nr:hypothetical protein QBC39DRAFT_254656 [Schizothecium conicum]
MLRQLRAAWRQRGWRRSTLLFSGLASLTFIANLTFAIWAMTSRKVTNGMGVVAENNCADIKRLNMAMHVLINALSTVLLAGSNYCMQCLSAPTRSEVDGVHKERRWMDIGVSSLRNIAQGDVDGRRTRLWLLLALSSLPLHLFYNSVVFQSISANTYNVWIMNEGWIATGDRSLITPKTLEKSGNQLEPLRAAINQGILKRLDTETCFSSYAQPFQSTNSDLVLVTATTTNASEPVFGLMREPGDVKARINGVGCPTAQTFQWMCLQYEDLVYRTSGNQRCERRCEEFLPRARGDARAGTWRPFFDKPVEYCYSLPSQEHCKLQFSRDLLITVIVLNLLKAVLMLACTFGWKDEPPLLTVGDAIASFIDRPDDSTADMCLLSKKRVESEWMAHKEPPKGADIFRDRRKRRGRGASAVKWTSTLFLFLFAIATCSFLLRYGINQIEGAPDESQNLFSITLGAIDTRTLMVTPISSSGASPSLLANVVLANTPQLIFSLLYFSYNGLFTAMSLSVEWSRFALRKKGLRRSGALSGSQRTTYFLQLPYRLALPLLVLSGAQHWLISQSIFLVFVEGYVNDPAAFGTTIHSTTKDMYGDDIVTCGWSPAGVVSVICVGGVMVVLLASFGAWRLPSAMPVAGSCSAAISAACHPPLSGGGGDEGELLLSMRELGWGETVTKDGRRTRHCCFSPGNVTYPTDGACYGAGDGGECRG